MVFLRRTTPTCFYCLSAPSPTPVDPRAFRCPHCGCWNRYDANGEILSDEPAMHDENLNTASFARRGSSPPTFFLPPPHSLPQHPPARTGSRPRTPDLPSATRVKPTKCSSSTSSQTISHLHKQVPQISLLLLGVDHSLLAPRLRSAPRAAPRLSRFVARPISSSLRELPTRSRRPDRAEKSDGSHKSPRRLAERKQRKREATPSAWRWNGP